MFEYLRGEKIISEEHMLSCTELAAMYGLKFPDSAKPNGKLVSQVIKDFIKEHNIKTDEFWYLGGRHAMRVYPEEIWKPALHGFMYDMHMKHNGIYEYDVPDEKRRISFLFSPDSNSQIIIFNFRGGKH